MYGNLHKNFLEASTAQLFWILDFRCIQCRIIFCFQTCL